MRRLSLLTAWACCAILLAVRCSAPPRQVLSWDVFGYYLYLPATVIHHDTGLRDHAWLDGVMTTYEPSATLYQLVDGADGQRVIKYSAGMAVLYAPFFAVAHAAAPVLGYPADGFSPPYPWTIAFGCLLYAMLGLFVLRKVLLHFFSDRWTAALLALVVLGTNFLQLTALDGTLLTHTPLFLLYALLLWGTLRWHERPHARTALLIGASAGLITLVRPSEGVCLLIPLLWLPTGEAPWKRKWQLIATHSGHVLLAAGAFALAVLPQPLYWHAVTGQWLFYSYVNPGEGFDLATPHTLDFLFSFRKGWLLYTPLMGLALIGIPLLARWRREAFAAVLVFFLADLWVISSWSCWWYAGGSFSSRSLMPAYAVLALPLGVALQRLTAVRGLRGPTIAGAGLLVALNLFQTWQWTARILPKDRVTGAYYAAIFGRTAVPPGADRLLLVERPNTPDEHFTADDRYAERLLAHLTYDDQPDSVRLLTPEDPFAPAVDIPFAALTTRDHAWLRASARLWVGDSLPGAPPSLVLAFHHDGGAYKYRAVPWTLPADARRTWVPLTVDYLTPEVRAAKDNLKVYIWNEHGGTWRADDLQVLVYERK